VGTEKFATHVPAQIPGHHLGPGEGVQNRPGLRFQLDASEPQDGELQPQAVLVGGDVGVDPLGVGLQRHPALIVQEFQFLGGSAMPAQRTDEAVGVQRRLAQDLRQSAGADPPPELHLPEAILRVGVPLGEEQVVGVAGVDVGDAPAIADDGDLRL
jgi:hypothetical protein